MPANNHKPASNQRKKLNNRQHIMARYGAIVLMFLLFCGAIITKLSYTTIIDSKGWHERAKEELAKTKPIQPERGSILSANGNILACNQTLYDVRIDLRHPALTDLEAKDWARLDSLADTLDLYFPRTPDKQPPADATSPDSWRTLLRTELAKPRLRDRRKTATIAVKLPLEEFERISKFPYFKDYKTINRKCPLYKDPRIMRVYPFGDMAKLSIGRVYEDSIRKRIAGYAGLEKALDSLLYGKPGVARRVALSNGLSDWVAVRPVRGYDILTTIDIDMQDILEGELLAICDSMHAEWGTAVLMEVNTGEIKAISNVERDSVTGKYIEATNRAVVAYEPGSVMKTISLMVAFEDGIIKSANDMADCSPFMRTSDHAGGGMKSMKQILETSSNTGIARVIFRKYADNPDGFRQRLASMGLEGKINSGIGYEEKPNIPKLLPTRNGRPYSMEARHLDLARQAYGYNTAIPPLFTLAYYNAIANGGKLVRPHLVRALRDENGVDSVLPLSYIRKQVCSPHTAEMLKECLHEVVWGKRGTARALQDDRVEICGKTGTVMPYERELPGYNQNKRRYAFCGFFPYNNPRYSCIVLMTTQAGVGSAARASGRVLLNTALKLYARGLLNDVSSSYTASRQEDIPLLYGGNSMAVGAVSKALGMKGARTLQTASTAAGGGTVPDVKGMDVASAVRTLENKGITVSRINGAGYVTSQIPAAGSPLRRGATCSLRLAWRSS